MNYDYQYYYNPNQFDYPVETNESENKTVLEENINENIQDVP